MNDFEKSMSILQELFGRDYQFALATSANNVPTVRFVDMLFDNGCFYIVTYKTSQKVNDIQQNQQVAFCYKSYNFRGLAEILGHPLESENSEIRQKLISAFEPWYFKHNNENDENMCYLKILPTQGFFYKDGIGYQVDFVAKTAKIFPFEFDIVLIE